MPSNYVDIEQACKVLIDFIGSSRGGDSWLETPDGNILTTDWGYVWDGLRQLSRWVEEAQNASKQ